MALTDSSSQAAWFALLGALGGVLVSGLTALVTAVLNHRWQAEAQSTAESLDDRRRLREERRSCSLDFLDATDAHYQAAADLYYNRRSGSDVAWRDAMGSATGRVQTAYLRLTVTNSKPVRERAAEYMTVLKELSVIADGGDLEGFQAKETDARSVRDLLRDAIRADLGVTD